MVTGEVPRFASLFAMSRSSTRALRWMAVGLASTLLVVVGWFAAHRALSAGRVLGDVVVGGLSVGGMDHTELVEALTVLEGEIAVTPFTFLVNGSSPTVTPLQVGFTLNVDAIARRVMSLGREGSLSDQFGWWLRNLFRRVPVELEGSLDAEATRLLLEDWSSRYVGNPPFPGGIAVEGTTPVPLYPRPGEHIDPADGSRILLDAFLGRIDNPASLPVVRREPRLTPADVDRAVAQAKLWLSGPITLVAPGGDAEVTFGVEDLAAALVAEAGESELVLSFDPQRVGEVLERQRGVLEAPPVDARLEIDGYQVRVVPGRPGTLIDPEATASALAQAASGSHRRGVLPMREGADPEVTTEELEALGIRHLVASFTTYHSCCQNRVRNIHLIADTVDGVIVRPGETFGLNAFVGPRTAEKGYLPDGTIVQGELVETVGGGVSQFATTFYNAVFWGGYEDVRHKPHSFYFSRYPEGIEATISWPEPELEFRNDSDAAILIKTEYTDTSITVLFYGWNDGRILVGSHRDGRTNIEIVAEGGPQARRVEATVSERFAFTEPRTEYRANPDLDPDERVVTQKPSPGWSVKVTRKITQGGSERVQEWVVRYLPQREIVEVHPCRMPDATTTCPTTTTTTTSTTTTTQPETTTTTAGG